MTLHDQGMRTHPISSAVNHYSTLVHRAKSPLFYGAQINDLCSGLFVVFPAMAFIVNPLPTNQRNTSALQAPRCSLPPRVILDPLPGLFVYDHCPFCVRVRYALGHKNVKHNLIWLLNDDVTTPTALIGKKLVPIFQPEGPAGRSMPESMGIIEAIDSDNKFGQPGLFKPATSRDDISKWMDETAMPLRRLTRVRYSRATLPEFAFADARETYVKNHPLCDPDSYDENFNRSSEYIAEIQGKLNELDEMIYSKEFCSPGGLSYDDIVLFPKLRSFTVIKGLELPSRVKEYIEYQAQITEVPLYDYCAM